MQQKDNRSSGAMLKNLGWLTSISLNISLPIADYFLLQALQHAKKDSSQSQKYIAALVITTLATVLKLGWTIRNNRQYRHQNPTQDIAADIDPKILWHDFIQTTTKLACAAFGWQLAFLLTQHWMGYEYNSALNSKNWDKKIAIYLATGLGAMFFLNIGILASQHALFHCDNGAAVREYFILVAQLCLSVFIADGLWFLFTDLAQAASQNFKQKSIELILACILYPTFYLLQSFIFKYIHNALNIFHPNDDYHVKFVCDNKFVGVLWGAYAGFNLFPYLIDFKPHTFTALNVFLSSLIALFGTAIFPLIIGLSNYKESTLREPYEDSAPRIDSYIPLQDTTAKEDSDYKSASWSTVDLAESNILNITPDANWIASTQRVDHRFFAPVVIVGRLVNAGVQTMADTYPKF